MDFGLGPGLFEGGAGCGMRVEGGERMVGCGVIVFFLWFFSEVGGAGGYGVEGGFGFEGEMGGFCWRL